MSRQTKAARDGAGASNAGRATGGAADPSAAPSLERFEAVRRQTECVFARGTRLWGAEAWEPDAFARNIDRFAALLTRFAAVADAQRLDGILLEVAEPGAGATVERLAATTRAVVEGLTARDPAAAPGPLVDDPRWWLTFSGSALFVATFAPCYDTTSSRYGFGLEHTYLLFQTRASFVRRYAPGSGVLPESARVRTRAAFAASGRPYDLALTLSPLEANRFVKPGRLGEPPIEWWKAPRRPDERRERSDVR
ncbi:MAG: YqcI/YcgG family protein [Pseudonocardiaceae bacterium]